MKDKKFRNTMIVLGSLAIGVVAGVAIWLSLKPKHKHEDVKPTTEIKVVNTNPEPKITSVPTGEEAISAAYNYLIDLGADAGLANKIIHDNQSRNGKFHYIKVMDIKELFTKEDVDSKLTELASVIGINVSSLKTLTPSDHDGRIYISNLDNIVERMKLYDALKTGINYKYVVSNEYQIFEVAMISYHTGTNNKQTIDALQKAIDAIK